jgi:hypothetical protein
MSGRTEDADTSAGVVDHGQDLLTMPSQGEGLDEVHGQDRLGLGTQEASQVTRAHRGAG